MNQTVTPASLTQPAQVGNTAKLIPSKGLSGGYRIGNASFFFNVLCPFLNVFLLFLTGSAKARSDQLSWRDDSGKTRDADTGVRS